MNVIICLLYLIANTASIRNFKIPPLHLNFRLNARQGTDARYFFVHVLLDKICDIFYENSPAPYYLQIVRIALFHLYKIEVKANFFLILQQRLEIFFKLVAKLTS
jgi:hypothetical protein